MTPKLKSHTLNPIYLADSNSDIFKKSNLDFTVDPFDDDRTVRFLAVLDETKSPIVIESLYFLTNLNDKDLGLMDAIVAIAQGKNLLELKEIGMRELDYYLRQDGSVPSFKFYHDDHYKLLSSLEKMAKYIEDKKQTLPWLKVERDGEFLDLPTFEQLDIVDEILARFVTSPKLVDADIWCEDIEEESIFINTSRSLTPQEEMKLREVLNYHLQNQNLKVSYL